MAEKEITIENAIEVCRELERKLAPIGYHCGLTGSTLYSGASRKDIDIIIYPHQVAETLPLNRIIDVIELSTEMYPSQGVNPPNHIAPSTTDKLVVVGDYRGQRLDLFFLQ